MIASSLPALLNHAASRLLRIAQRGDGRANEIIALMMMIAGS